MIHFRWRNDTSSLVHLSYLKNLDGHVLNALWNVTLLKQWKYKNGLQFWLSRLSVSSSHPPAMKKYTLPSPFPWPNSLWTTLNLTTSMLWSTTRARRPGDTIRPHVLAMESGTISTIRGLMKSLRRTWWRLMPISCSIDFKTYFKIILKNDAFLYWYYLLKNGRHQLTHSGRWSL